MASYDENLDNCLVSQKNFILRLINEATKYHDWQKLCEASILLGFITELWERFEYGYKRLELNLQIQQAKREHFNR